MIKGINTDYVVTSAFVFEKDLKGVLKNGSCRANAREDYNALEAQSTSG